MSKKKVVILRLLLAVIGAAQGVFITLLLFVLMPGSFRIASSLFVMNVGFWTAYQSSYRMKQSVLAPYFVFIFAVTSITVCLWFYGPTWLGLLNILGCAVTIAGCVMMGVHISRICEVVKKKRADSGNQNENKR